MDIRPVRLIVVGLILFAPARSAEISGTVIIERQLTKRKVTVPFSAYERGVAVPTGVADEPDALAFERTHVVVYLEGDLSPDAATATMEQKGKLFVPDLLAISAGSNVSFPNLDPIFHNVFSLSKTKEFDLGNYPMNKTRLVTFSKPGIVFVNCHLHPNMTAVIVVCPNSFHIKPDASGKFVFPDVPPGTYRVVAWHKTAGFFRQSVSITNREPASISFKIPLSLNP